MFLVVALILFRICLGSITFSCNSVLLFIVGCGPWKQVALGSSCGPDVVMWSWFQCLSMIFNFCFCPPYVVRWQHQAMLLSFLRYCFLLRIRFGSTLFCYIVLFVYRQLLPLVASVGPKWLCRTGPSGGRLCPCNVEVGPIRTHF